MGSWKLVFNIMVIIIVIINNLSFKGARELALDDSNQQSEYKAEIKHLKETFEVQVFAQDTFWSSI